MMQVPLTPQQEDLIRELIAAYSYGDMGALLDDALLALQEKIAALNSALDKGAHQIDRGETLPYDLTKIKASATARINSGLGYTREDSAALSAHHQTQP